MSPSATYVRSVPLSSSSSTRTPLSLLQSVIPDEPPFCECGIGDSEELNGGGFRSVVFLRALLGGIRARLGTLPSTVESKLCDWWLALRAEPFSLDRGRFLWEMGVERRLLASVSVSRRKKSGRTRSDLFSRPRWSSALLLCALDMSSKNSGWTTHTQF